MDDHCSTCEYFPGYGAHTPDGFHKWRDARPWVRNVWTGETRRVYMVVSDRQRRVVLFGDDGSKKILGPGCVVFFKRPDTSYQLSPENFVTREEMLSAWTLCVAPAN